MHLVVKRSTALTRGEKKKNKEDEVSEWRGATIIEFHEVTASSSQILSNLAVPRLRLFSFSFALPFASADNMRGSAASVTFLMTTAPIGATGDKSRVMRAEVNHGPL